jgi:hypothetical protein
MKTTRSFTLIFLALFITAAMASCKKCKNESPRARILNNGTKAASVQVKTTGGNTVNINNIQPQTASEYASYAAGDVVFTITVDKVVAEKTVLVANCFDYDIAIDAQNVITVFATDRND